MDGRVYLKIKLKSLAAESRIIRHEERKRKVRKSLEHYDGGCDPHNLNDRLTAKGMREEDKRRRSARRSRDWYPKSLAELHQLQLHRRNVVSKEARLTHIAYAYIRGRTLAQTDGCAGLSLDDFGRVEKMVQKYGPSEFQRKPLETWLGVDLASIGWGTKPSTDVVTA